MITIKVFTLFPDVFDIYFNTSILGRALKKNIWKYEIINIRDYTKDKHKKVDDVVFGGGSGMLLKPDVVADAIDSNCDSNTKIYYMSPRGEVFNQEKTKEIIKYKDIAFICGRYEGLDQRVIDYYHMEELSVGDYVLTGGELPAMTIIDACIRNIDGTIEKDSLENESFKNNLLEYPQYTQPRIWRNITIPEVLISGHHKNIEKWKLSESEKITKERRKDIWEKYNNSQN
jgi:tRNA (guanine37-N1)-methyltransferase